MGEWEKVCDKWEEMKVGLKNWKNIKDNFL